MTQDSHPATEPIVGQFLRAWQSGEQPRLEAYLPEDVAERARLLLKLVPIDIAYRRRAGEFISAESYRRRFPELADTPQHLLEGRAAAESAAEWTLTPDPFSTDEIAQKAGRGAVKGS